ncbi:MAG: PocR ligand-binding domain-containing protein [Candidatus Gracilibacteria bacterium]|jgi:PAS domain S-box-containing protein
MSKLKLTDVISLRTLQKIQDSFADAAGMPVSLRDLDNELITNISNKTNLWRVIETIPEMKALWNEKNLEALEESVKTGEVIIYERHAETYTFAVPVTVNGRSLAYFIGGLVRFGNPNIELCKKEAELLRISLDEFLDLYLQVPLITRKRLEAAGYLLKTIANTISNLEIESTQAKAETKAIIQDHEMLKKEIAHKNQLLNEHSVKYQTLFHEVQDGIFTVDMEGKILDVNPAGAAMLGHKVNETIGTYTQNYYVHLADKKKYLDSITRFEHIQNFYPELRIKGGGTIIVELSAVLMKDKNGKNIGIQGIFRDISCRKHQKLEDNSQNHVTEQQTIKSAQNHQGASK